MADSQSSTRPFFLHLSIQYQSSKIDSCYNVLDNSRLFGRRVCHPISLLYLGSLRAGKQRFNLSACEFPGWDIVLKEDIELWKCPTLSLRYKATGVSRVP